MLPLLLGQLPPITAPENTGLYILILASALPGVLSVVVAFVQWLGKRTVDREDKDREELKQQLKDHEKRFSTMEDAMEMSRRAADQRFAEMDRTLVLLQSEVKQTHSLVETVRGAVTKLEVGLESRFDKQAGAYTSSLKEQTLEFNERLEKLEFEIRSSVQRAIADSMPHNKRKRS